MAGAAAGGAVAGILIANNLARLRKGVEEAPAAWAPLEGRGLKLTTLDERPSLVGTVDGVECEVRIVTDFVHNAHTEVRAKLTLNADVRVGVHPAPSGIFGYVRSKLGQDIEVGDEAFDRAYLITARPESVARAIVDETLRGLLASISGGPLVGFVYEGDKVMVVLNGIETNAAVVGTALDAVVHVAKLANNL